MLKTLNAEVQKEIPRTMYDIHEKCRRIRENALGNQLPRYTEIFEIMAVDSSYL